VRTWSELPPSFSSHPSQAPRVLIGGNCLSVLRQTPEIERPAAILDTPLCFHLLVGRTQADHLIASGAFLANAEWIVTWPHHAHNLGLEDNARREKFRASTRRIVLLDTCRRPEAAAALEAFGRAVDLPTQRIPVGLDHLRLTLEHLIMQRRMEHSQNRHGEAQAASQRQLARYAMAMELLSGLTRARSETEAIAQIREMVVMLFAPGATCLAPVRDGQVGEGHRTGPADAFPQSRIEPFAASGEPYAWAEDRRSFLVRIGDARETLGVLGIGQMMFPQFADHYLNQMLAMAGILAMALRNARIQETAGGATA